jgi:hypothetical protein
LLKNDASLLPGFQVEDFVQDVGFPEIQVIFTSFKGIGSTLFLKNGLKKKLQKKLQKSFQT